MDHITKDLHLLVEEHGGVVSGKDLREAGIDRVMLYGLLVSGILQKEYHGSYVLADNRPDEYAILQSRSDKLIFSHATALFLHGMSDRVPHILDITVPQGDNVSRIKKDHQDTRFHYCKKDLWSLGVEDTVTPQGFHVRAYDPERCICDLIRGKEKVDRQIYAQAIRDFFSRKIRDPRRIISYARSFNIEDQVRDYMEVLQ